jgi:polysaccharide export outer membrane protein
MIDFSPVRAAALSLIGLGIIILGACATGPASAEPQARDADVTTSASTGAADEYRLGTGDQIKVTVFGEANLSGSFEVDGQGSIVMPLINFVVVRDLTLREVEDAIETKLRDGIMREPQVSVEMTRGRPFYIRGEVNRPGQFAFSPGLSVLNAITAAGDFTYRADKNNVFIKGANEDRERKINPKDGALVKPGDTIRVRERFF